MRVGFTEAFPSLATREILDYETRQPRLLRCLYGLGTNTGLKRMVAYEESVTRICFICAAVLSRKMRCVRRSDG